MIGKAVQKLTSMFNPVGALIQAVITIYNMIQFFIERAKQIASLVNAVFNSIAEIASGNLKKAVAAVEDSLVKTLPVAISFLANLVGIGGLAAKIKEIIQKIRKPIDKVVDKVVGFIAGKAKALLGMLTGADKSKEELPRNEKDHDAQVEAGLAALDGEERKHLENNAISRENAEKVAVIVKKAYPVFKSISIIDGGETWDYDYVASPGRRKQGEKKKEQSKALKGIGFKIKNWRDYPGYLPKPKGPFRLLQNGEYEEAREEANKVNRAIHAANPQLVGKQIHEIKPVKFGGSPTEPSNKIPLTPSEHAKATTWWRRLQI